MQAGARTKDQILVLLDLYEIAKANMSRTESMLTQILGGLESDQVIPVLTAIAKDPNVRLGIRNKAVQILGKKSPEDVATAFAELLGDPNTNLEVREFAINTMAGVKQENLIFQYDSHIITADRDGIPNTTFCCRTRLFSFCSFFH